MAEIDLLNDLATILRAAGKGNVLHARTLCDAHPESNDFCYLADQLAKGLRAFAPEDSGPIPVAPTALIATILSRAWDHHTGVRKLLALIGYRTVLTLDPANRDAMSSLGVLRMQQDNIAASLTALNRAANLLDPSLRAADLRRRDRELDIRFGHLAATVANHLVDTVRTIGDAMTVFHRLAPLFRHCKGFYHELAMLAARSGIDRVSQGEHSHAIALERLSIVLDPTIPTVYSNLGYALEMTGRHAPAEQPYRRGALLETNRSRKSYAYMLLKHLCFRLGYWNYFSEYLPYKLDYEPLGWWKAMLPTPLWDGTLKPGSSILIYGEAGFGDVIQCIRYAEYFHAHGMMVHVACDHRLASLCRLVKGVETVMVSPRDLPDTDWRSLSFDLFYMIEHDPERTYRSSGYIDPSNHEQIGPSLERRPGEFLIGIKWTTTDPAKDLPFDAFVQLQLHPGVRFISLQPEAPPPCSSVAVERPLDDFFNSADSFLITAQVIGQLDLVITADSVITHLAGAIGIETWVVLKAIPDWRWMLERTDTPLYDSVRLFRQPPGASGWASTFDALEAALRRHPAMHARIPVDDDTA